MIRLKLTIDSPERKSPRELLAERFPFRLGRSLQNDVPLLSPSVSSQHVVIEYIDESLRVTDLDSTNGTYVRGQRLSANQPRPIELPETLQLGDVHIEVARPESSDTLFTMAESATKLREMVDQVVARSNAADDAHPFLEIMSGPGGGKRFELDPECAQITIGTDDTADIALDLPRLPAELATIFWEGTRCWIQAHQPAVRCQDEPVDRCPLRSGDRFVIGAVELLFFDPLEDALDLLDAQDQRETAPTDAAQANDDPSPVSQERSEPATTDDLPAFDSPTDPPHPSQDTDDPAEWGAVEIALLAMSALFAVSALGLLVIFFAL